MDDIFTKLLNAFFVPPDMEAAEREIEDYYRLLIERLDKPERKLVLRIMNQIRNDAHMESNAFPCGRQLFSEVVLAPTPTLTVSPTSTPTQKPAPAPSPEPNTSIPQLYDEPDAGADD